jgi:hypothetical protein
MANTTYTERTTTGKTLSSSSNWKRKWRVQVYQHTTDTSSKTVAENSEAQTGDTVLDVSDLHIKFEVKRFALYYPNQATITIYNLNAATETTIIEEGYRVTLSAGYYSGDTDNNFGQIFDGTVIMCNRWKQDGTDYILQILALDSSTFINEGYCSFALNKGQTVRSVINSIAAQASNPINNVMASTYFDTATYSSKGTVVHGLAKNTLSDIAKTHNGTWFIDNGTLYVVKYSDDQSTWFPENKNEAIELSETTGLIGNPKQVNQGVTARMLLNPKIAPYCMVHINDQLITAQLPTIGSYSNGIGTVFVLDSKGLYRVISVTFTGDSRGQDWYADISTVTQSGEITETLTYN